MQNAILALQIATHAMFVPKRWNVIRPNYPTEYGCVNVSIWIAALFMESNCPIREQHRATFAGTGQSEQGPLKSNG